MLNHSDRMPVLAIFFATAVFCHGLIFTSHSNKEGNQIRSTLAETVKSITDSPTNKIVLDLRENIIRSHQKVLEVIHQKNDQQHLQILPLDWTRENANDPEMLGIKLRRQQVELSETSLHNQPHQRIRRLRQENTERQRYPRAVASSCSIVPHNPELPLILAKLENSGEIHLIEYNLTFPEYSFNPLDIGLIASTIDDNSFVIESHLWQRVMSRQGKVLLTFAFNYDALSMGLLGYGVKKMDVPLVDVPPLCFANQSKAQKMSLLLELLLHDFEKGDFKRAKSLKNSNEPDRLDSDPWKSASSLVCHQTVRNDSGHAIFSHACCTTDPSDRTNCFAVKTDYVFDILKILIVSFKILFFLCGPVILQKVLLSDTADKSEYIVPLTKDMLKTILVRRVPFGVHEPASEETKKMQQFVGFRELLKDLRSEEVVRVKFRKLDLVVDNKDLMLEDQIPVGLFLFLFDAFVRCGVISVEPFRSCCKESVIGSWSPYFLWIRLKKHASDCNRGCKEICSWSSLFRCLGWLLLMAIIPLPYYVRLVAFEWFEKEELERRNKVREQLRLDHGSYQDLYQCLTPEHFFVITVHALFSISYIILVAARATNSEKVDDFILQSVTDMQKLRRKECLRLVCAHIVLPFEKFGLCGVLVAAFYWPLVLPFCLATCLFYCVPTLYLVGRFVATKRIQCLRTKPISSHARDIENNGSLSEGVTSFSSCLMLNRISFERDEELQADKIEYNSKPAGLRLSRAKVAEALGAALVAISTIVCMLTILTMYSEALGFLLEMSILISIGAVVNADHSITKLILLFWALVYVVAPYRLVQARYLALSKRIFEYITPNLQDSIESACIFRKEKSLNTAFKFSVEANSSTKQVQAVKESCPHSENHGKLGTSHNGVRKVSDFSVEVGGQARLDTATSNEGEASIEYRNKRLHWKIKSLVMFVDQKDRSRIPRDLFWKICELDIPGSPGPLWRSMAKATAYVMASLLYLFLLYIVVSLSTEMQHISTSHQAIVVFFLGSLPVILSVVFCKCTQDKYLQLNEHSLTGRVKKTISSYETIWPVQDLLFSRYDQEDTIDGDGSAVGRNSLIGDREQERSNALKIDRQSFGSRGRASFDPSQVDLLITIRDEPHDGDDPDCHHSPDTSSSPGECNSRKKSDAQRLSQAIPLRNMSQRTAKCLSDPLNSSFRNQDIFDGSVRQSSAEQFPVGSADSGSPLLVTTGDILVAVDQFHFNQ